MGLSQAEAHQVLGLQHGASPEDVRKAFRQKALQYHPDKNKDNPDAAAERFKILTRAYQKLSRPTDEKAWEDLDVSDILTEEFFNEAFKQDIPPFELLYIQQVLASQQSQGDPGNAQSKELPSVWVEGSQDTAQNQMWRSIHQAMQRKHRRKGKQATDMKQPNDKPKTVGQWALFWDFLTEWVGKEEQGTSKQQASKPNLWSKEYRQQSTSHQSISSPHTGSGYESTPVLLLEGPESKLNATQRRRIGAAWRARALAMQQQSMHGCDSHSITSTVASQQDLGHTCHAQQGSEGEDTASELQQTSSDSDSAHLTKGEISSHAPSILTASSCQSSNHVTQAAIASPLMSNQDAHQQCQEHRATAAGKHHVQPRNCQWLTWHNCFVWTKRILLIKALLMLMLT